MDASHRDLLRKRAEGRLEGGAFPFALHFPFGDVLQDLVPIRILTVESAQSIIDACNQRWNEGRSIAKLSTPSTRKASDELQSDGEAFRGRLPS